MIRVRGRMWSCARRYRGTEPKVWQWWRISAISPRGAWSHLLRWLVGMVQVVPPCEEQWVGGPKPKLVVGLDLDNTCGNDQGDVCATVRPDDNEWLETNTPFFFFFKFHFSAPWVQNPM
jgi:hypothetical protein